MKDSYLIVCSAYYISYIFHFFFLHGISLIIVCHSHAPAFYLIIQSFFIFAFYWLRLVKISVFFCSFSSDFASFGKEFSVSFSIDTLFCITKFVTTFSQQQEKKEVTRNVNEKAYVLVHRIFARRSNAVTH